MTAISDFINGVLDDLPVATILTIAAAIGGVIALANGSISYQDLLIGLGITTTGSAALGHVRNTAGKGVVPGPLHPNARPTPKKRKAAYLEK